MSVRARTRSIHIRLSESEADTLTEIAVREGFSTLAEALRYVIQTLRERYGEKATEDVK